MTEGFPFPLPLTPEALDQMKRERDNAQFRMEARKVALYNFIEKLGPDDLRVIHYLLHLDRKSRQVVDGMVTWQLHTKHQMDIHSDEL